jgi:hypothetical protein
MKTHIKYRNAAILIVVCLGFLTQAHNTATACASVSRGPVVNADQSVIIWWDAETKTQHFIRQATFKTEDKNIGFIVPSPTQPELEETGDAAFNDLEDLTAPMIRNGFSFPLGCSTKSTTKSGWGSVDVLEEKRVAGFDAVVLKAGSSAALIEWLANHGYSNSPELAAWADPYIKKGWPFTALKVAANDKSPANTNIRAKSLRISFKTDTPLFPYREPYNAETVKKLGANKRLLRIYFIADSAVDGIFATGDKWTGKRVWSDSLDGHESSLQNKLGLPESIANKKCWLTVFEDQWPYTIAPDDITFVKSKNQKRLKRKTQNASIIDPLFVIIVSSVFLTALTATIKLFRKSKKAS